MIPFYKIMVLQLYINVRNGSQAREKIYHKRPAIFEENSEAADL